MKRKYLVIAAAAALVLSACGSGGDTDDANPTVTEAAPGECAYVPDGRDAGVEVPPADPDVSGTVESTMDIQSGDIEGTMKISLDADAAPCTVNSFVSLVEQDFYNGVSCHRVTSRDAGIQVLQCGDPQGTGAGGPGYTIPDEFRPDMTYGPGTLAMAKTRAPDSGGSQFFIVYGGEENQLPPQYTVFGQITEGLETVEAIGDAGAQGGAPDGAPVNPVEVTSVTLD